jgi:hypothetical protein
MFQKKNILIIILLIFIILLLFKKRKKVDYFNTKHSLEKYPSIRGLKYVLKLYFEKNIDCNSISINTDCNKYKNCSYNFNRCENTIFNKLNINDSKLDNLDNITNITKTFFVEKNKQIAPYLKKYPISEAFTIPHYKKYLTKDDLKKVVAGEKLGATNLAVSKIKECSDNCQEINGVYKCFDHNNIEKTYCISNDHIIEYNNKRSQLEFSFYKLLQDYYATYLTLEDEDENILKVIQELQSFIKIINDKATNKNLTQIQKDKIDNVYNYWKKDYNIQGRKFEPVAILKNKMSKLTEKLKEKQIIQPVRLKAVNQHSTPVHSGGHARAPQLMAAPEEVAVLRVANAEVK